LELLAEHGFTATFFVRGNAAEESPELVRRIVAEGHELGNHSMTHRDLIHLSESEIESELSRANDVIEELGGRRPRWFRPPFGHYNDSVLQVAERLGLKTVMWSVSPEDWSCPGAAQMVDITLGGVEPGAIVLFHDGCGHLAVGAPVPTAMSEQAVAAFPRIFEALRSRGLRVSAETNA
jgi:chitooligosaccharide deacetylase